ncbi:MAG: hypothetical protein GC164_08955 [Phycisphaera sp.]|nr:hypothetical protein [Phycisphaera sp.]
MTKISSWTVMGCLLLSLAACHSQTKTSDKDIQLIDAKGLVALLNKSESQSSFGWLSGNSSKVTVVDVRPAVQYKAAHIPGAINIHLPDITSGDMRLSGSGALVVYAGGWNDYRSPAAAKKLIALGYKNIHDFRGGLEAWIADGQKTEGQAQVSD